MGVTERDEQVGSLLHLVYMCACDTAPKDLGPVAIRNPDYTNFKDESGKELPWHHGLIKLPDGTTTTRHVILGIAEGPAGAVYLLALAPYTLLEVQPFPLTPVAEPQGK
jgi:hypothetical protein